MIQLDREMGPACLQKLRSGAAMLALLVFGMLAISPASGAAAAQRPIAIAHAPAPFGRYYKPACSPSAGYEAGCFALVLTSATGKALATSLPSGYGPVDLQTAYGLSTPSATRGAGQTVAIVDAFDDPNAEADLAVYRSMYGLSACTTANGCFRKVNQEGQQGNYPPASSSSDDWIPEESLDMDMVSAIAPNAHIVLVEADSDSFADLGASVDEAVALGATQVSNSYGGDEYYGQSQNSDYNHPGTAIVASSGDHGYYGDSQDANFPASSQYVEAIGGTSLTSTSPRIESAWGPSDGISWGAGSGCSAIFPKPSWQHDPSCSGRMVADVSADADPATGVAVYISSDDPAGYGGWYVFGGTSASSPIIAGVDALVGPAASSPQWAYQNPSVWNDVTTGNDITSYDCAIAYFCDGEVGYDGPTGLGTPNGAELPSSCSTSPLISTNPSSQTVTAPGGASFTAAATNPAGCSTLSVQWQLSTNGGTNWSNDTTDSGNTTDTLSINPTSISQPGNEYRATFTNEHGTTNSSAATLTVNAPCSTSPLISTNPSNQTVTAPGGASFTAAATNPAGCSTLSVQWQLSTNGGTNWSNVNAWNGGGSLLRFCSGPVIMAWALFFEGTIRHLPAGLDWSGDFAAKALIFTGAAWILRTWYRYHGEFERASIGNLVRDTEVSQTPSARGRRGRRNRGARRARGVLEPDWYCATIPECCSFCTGRRYRLRDSFCAQCGPVHRAEGHDRGMVSAGIAALYRNGEAD